jgi:hypothetical protein
VTGADARQRAGAAGPDSTRVEAAATCLSWIPPQAVAGMFQLPFGLGVAHYDKPPPDSAPDIAGLLTADAIRFANQMRAWIEVRDGEITDYGMSGHGRLGSTTVRLGSRALTFAGVALPDLVAPPEVHPGRIRFTQTAGGHTGAAVPRHVRRPPYVRLTAPIAWSTVALTIHADGSSQAELAGASCFPRHYLYDTDGNLTHKSALISYRHWLRRAEHEDSPWSGAAHPVPVAHVRGAAERTLADTILVSGGYRQHRLPAGALLSEAPIAETEVHVLLDGLLVIEFDGKPIVDVGPGAIFDPAKRTQVSKEHATVRAKTPCRLAVLARDHLDSGALLGVATEQTSQLQAYLARAADAGAGTTGTA